VYQPILTQQIRPCPPTQYIDSFHKIFTVNSDYFPNSWCSALGLCNGDGLSSLWVRRNRIFRRSLRSKEERFICRWCQCICDV